MMKLLQYTVTSTVRSNIDRGASALLLCIKKGDKMTLEGNLRKELSLFKDNNPEAQLQVYQLVHGSTTDAVIALLDQMHWNMVQRAYINGQDSIKKENT